MNIQLLKKRFEEAPRMEPQDAVKLAFQSAFGCGHLLPGRERCIEMIRQELEATPEQADMPVCTPIGNGLCRIHLAAPEVRALGVGMIERMMRVTDESVRARPDNDARYLDVVNQAIELARLGDAPFDAQAMQAYLDAYHKSGRPVVSHTPAYRAAYQPAYRVVLTDLALLIPVLLAGRSVIVIDGACGSGKSTLAGLLGRMVDATPIPMDDFFLPFDMRTPERLGQPGGNVHYERFRDEVLKKLEVGKAVRWNRFNCSDGAMIPREIPSAQTVIIEGSYSHHPFFRDELKRLNALRVFVRVDEEEQLRRIEKRDPELLSMFQSRWIPLEKNYFEGYDIREAADVVIASQHWDTQSLFLEKEE